MIKHYKLAVLGAGASGLAAAVAAKREAPGLTVALLERNADPGRKILATGNGRCNYLNKNACPSDYKSGSETGDAQAFAAEVFSQCSVTELAGFFRTLGIEPAEEDGGRLYPRSRQAASVRDALADEAKELGIDLFTAFHAVSLAREKGGFLITAENGGALAAERVILATGGKAGIQYGSSGDGYKLAMALGVAGEKPVPALTMLICAEDMEPVFGVRAEGRVSLIRITENAGSPEDAVPLEETAASDCGEIQFAREGISGICTFNVSRAYRIGEGLSYVLSLDLFTDKTAEALEAALAERRDRFAGRQLPSLFIGLLPEKLGLYLLGRLGFTERQRLCASLSDRDIAALAALCKDLRFTVIGSGGWKEAQVTSGGLSLAAFDPQTMEARKVPGLYTAGEILDIDGPCGGYNLTWAFASGITAGRQAARAIMKDA